MPRRIGLDLGTDYTRIISEEGKVFRFPTVIVMDKYAERIAAVGRNAKMMLGKTPDHMEAICPVRNGVVANGTACSDMLRSFFEEIGMSSLSEVFVSVSAGITEMEVTNIRQAIYGANVRKVTLVNGIICSAIGAGIQYRDIRGSMILDLGGGLNRAAVLSLADVAKYSAQAAGGDAMDEAIVAYLRQKKGVTIGLPMAERLKIQVGSAHPRVKKTPVTVIGQGEGGRGIVQTDVTSDDMREALSAQISGIVELVNRTIADTPPELCADIGDFGIMLTGGSACLSGMTQVLQERIRVRVTMANEPQDVTAKGLKILMESGRVNEYALR